MTTPLAARGRCRCILTAVLAVLGAIVMTADASFAAAGPYQRRELIDCGSSPCVATFPKVPASTRLTIRFASCYITSTSQMGIGISHIGPSPAFGVTNKFRHHLIWQNVSGDGAYWAFSQPVLLDIAAGTRPEIQVVRIFGENFAGECSISGEYFDAP